MLETGLQDKVVRAKLRPLLENSSVADEQLMESTETERQNKMASKKGARVNTVGTATVSNEPTQIPSNQASQKKESKPNSLV